jgi:hypothetical protein
VTCLAKTTVDLLIDREKSLCANHDAGSSATTAVVGLTSTTAPMTTTNNEDNIQISFHLNDNYDNEVSVNPNVNSANNNGQQSINYDQQAPSVGSMHNFDYNNSNVPSVGKAVNDNSINNDGSSIASASSVHVANNVVNAQNDPVAFTTLALDSVASQQTDECSSCDNRFEMNIYKPNSEPKGIWLIAPLIGKLQVTCHSKVVEYACKN